MGLDFADPSQLVPVADRDKGDGLRATFLHPDGRREQTKRGQSHVASDGSVYVAANSAPAWIKDTGVEVVVADERGDVHAAFEIGSVSRDGDAFVLRP